MQSHSELALKTKVEDRKPVPVGEPASILIYGRDARLLETRGWVLEQAGMKVRITTEVADVERILASEPIDLFILCHTLSPEESDRCLAQANTFRPSMKKLVLTANTRLGSLGANEVIVSAFDGPRTLVAIVDELLSESRL